MATRPPARFTPEDLLAMTDRPMPELVDGQLVEREIGHKDPEYIAKLRTISLSQTGHKGPSCVT
ncbi:MAG TPA: hypothetical protein VGZ22_22660 [Isosphaeraceae bacterium]|jgi:hypothetical protein|nr:hypothetical protein [Isosphaeraceae bacterium]